MKRGIQKITADRAGISEAFLSEIINGRKRPSWKTAKKLAEATNSDPVLWLEGSASEIKRAFEIESN